MKHIILHTLADNLKLLPFLFITYLIMEFLEHHAGSKTEEMVQKSGRFGPVIGGILGVFPQCGFSAAASNLYVGGVITVGTLFAIYLSTSDEMLPILISSAVPFKTIAVILVLKMVIGIVAGIIIDLIVKKKKEPQKLHIHEMCEHEHCHCEKGVFYSAVVHTLKIFIFLLGLSFLLNLFMHTVGEDALSRLVFNIPVLGCFLSGLIGLIPNCAASVLITQLYLQNGMGFGAMMSGLLVSAGVGLLVLCRVHPDKKECGKIIIFLYAIGVAAGVLLELSGIGGLL